MIDFDAGIHVAAFSRAVCRVLCGPHSLCSLPYTASASTTPSLLAASATAANSVLLHFSSLLPLSPGHPTPASQPLSPLPPLLARIGSGLHFLWSKNLVHRDLKPQNLLLTGPGLDATLKIADFGFARHLAQASMAETICGSPLYMVSGPMRRLAARLAEWNWPLLCLAFDVP